MRPRSQTSISDENLLAGCLRGEEEAWNVLVDKYAALIYSIPLKYGLAEADAGDVFQTVCATLVEKLDTVRDPRRLAAWIITTTTRECWAVVRERSRDTAAMLQTGPRGADEEQRPDVDLADGSPLPEDVLLALERQMLVRHAVRQLPEVCRELVEALFTDTRQRSSYQDLASSLGIPLNSLGPTRARCLAKLRRLLDAAGYTA